MNIDESDILEYNCEPLALACLIAADVMFINTYDYNQGKGEKLWNTCVYVNCSDVFAWACCDAECIANNDNEPGSEIIELYKLWKENPMYGPVKWICVKRNMQPQYPLKRRIQEAGYWDAVFDALPLNYDSLPKPVQTANAPI